MLLQNHPARQLPPPSLSLKSHGRASPPPTHLLPKRVSTLPRTPPPATIASRRKRRGGDGPCEAAPARASRHPAKCPGSPSPSCRPNKARRQAGQDSPSASPSSPSSSESAESSVFRPVPTRAPSYVPYKPRTTAEQLALVVEDADSRLEWETKRGPDQLVLDILEIVAGPWGRRNEPDEPLTALVSVPLAKFEWCVHVRSNETLYKAVLPVARIARIDVGPTFARVTLSSPPLFFKKSALSTQQLPWIPTHDFRGPHHAPALHHALHLRNVDELIRILFPRIGSPRFRELKDKVQVSDDVLAPLYLPRELSPALDYPPVPEASPPSTFPSTSPFPSFDLQHQALTSCGGTNPPGKDFDDFNEFNKYRSRGASSASSSATLVGLELDYHWPAVEWDTDFERLGVGSVAWAPAVDRRLTPPPAEQSTSACQWYTTPPRSTSPWKTSNSACYANSTAFLFDPTQAPELAPSPAHEDDLAPPPSGLAVDTDHKLEPYSPAYCYPSPQSTSLLCLPYYSYFDSVVEAGAYDGVPSLSPEW